MLVQLFVYFSTKTSETINLALTKEPKKSYIVGQYQKVNKIYDHTVIVSKTKI